MDALNAPLSPLNMTREALRSVLDAAPPPEWLSKDNPLVVKPQPLPTFRVNEVRHADPRFKSVELDLCDSRTELPPLRDEIFLRIRGVSPFTFERIDYLALHIDRDRFCWVATVKGIVRVPAGKEPAR